MDSTKTIQQMSDAFLVSLNSEGTVRSYRVPLRRFCTLLRENGVDPEQDGADVLTVNHAIDFADRLKSAGPYKASTIKLYLSAVRGFYSFLLNRGAELSDGSMARLESAFKRARDIRGEERPNEHKLESVQAVIAAAYAVQVPSGHENTRRRTLVRLRDIAIVETLRATGCRRVELVGLRVKDVENEGKAALVRGKGSKYRKVYWDERAWGAVMRYIRARGVDAASNASIFVGHGNKNESAALSKRHISRIVERLARKAGCRDVTSHYFRHVFATRALDRIDNLAVVQDLLGHASPVTTRVYARTDERKRRAAHKGIWGEKD